MKNEKGEVLILRCRLCGRAHNSERLKRTGGCQCSGGAHMSPTNPSFFERILIRLGVR